MTQLYLIITKVNVSLNTISLRFLSLLCFILHVVSPSKAQVPTISVSVSNPLSCTQLGATLSATTSCTGPITYSFSGPNRFSLVNTTGVASVTVNGVFSVTATDAAGTCVASNTALVSSDLHPDYLPLVDFYNSTGGPNWTNKTGWLTNCDPCSGWFGITCSAGRVTNLFLTFNNLAGTIPSSISGLSKLKDLSLAFSSNLTGTIPGSISTLKDLRTLGILYCGVSGTIFDKVIGLTQLENLYLSYSNIIDQIPENISALTNLKNIVFFANRDVGFTGTLPASLSALTGLQNLSLVGNQLTGTIPSGLGQLTNLEVLYLDENQLTGSIPSELGNLVNLKHLSLAFNQLTGSLPASLGTLNQLTYLHLNLNKLSGCIPLSYSALCGKDVNIDENTNLPSWTEFCANGGNTLMSVKDGNWFDSTVWSCGTVPTIKDYVTIQHNLLLPAPQSGLSRKIIYKNGGRLNFDPGSNLKIGQ